MSSRLAPATASAATGGKAATKTPQQLYNDAVAAYKNKDFATYLSAMSELYALRPKLPIVVANYAGALALNGRPEEAVALRANGAAP